MKAKQTSTDSVQPDFTPPHCVNRKCSQFSARSDIAWFKPAGFHKTQAHGIVSRFQCLSCRQSFSRQSFDLHYWSKRRLAWPEIEKIATHSVSDRAKARDLKVAPGTIRNKISRLSKFFLDKHAGLLDQVHLKENVCADGFETFCGSQYLPGQAHILIGADSQFALSWDYVTLKRKGRMTPGQKKFRDQLHRRWKIPAQALPGSFTRGVLDPLVRLRPRLNRPVKLITDEHKAYPRAMADHKDFARLLMEGIYSHETVSGKRARTLGNPLFASNYIDRELRKDLCNHVRETVRFSRDPNVMMERMSLHLTLHNLKKRYRINQRVTDSRKHYHVVGLRTEQVENPKDWVFLRRPFRQEQRLGSAFVRLWDVKLPKPSPRPKKLQAEFWSD